MVNFWIILWLLLTLYLVLPAAQGELSVAELDGAAGGILPYIEQDNLIRKK
jgi:hypothetical protein